MHKKKIYIFGILVILILGLVIFFRNAPPSPIYYVKTFREYLQSLFVFGNEDRASWLLTLSDKRLEESNFLINRNLNLLAEAQYDKAMEYSMEAEVLILSLKDKTNTTYLQDKLNVNRQRASEISVFLK